ncbi:MAG TPA: M15 family metallopeptidase [Caulobacteraceae bacterium]
MTDALAGDAANDSTKVNADLSLLAPLFRAAVLEAIAACNDPNRPGGALGAKVFEGFRTPARQAWLYAQGRTRPGDIVTNAPTNLTSWHGYGLAVDVVAINGYWTPFGKDAKANEKWFADVAAVFKATRCNWGGDWKRPDTPHMQWARCAASPSDKARALLKSGGLPAVWKAVGALDDESLTLVSPASASAFDQPVAKGTYRSLVEGGFFSANPSDLTVKRSIRTNNPGALNDVAWERVYPGYAGVTQADSAGNKTAIYWTPEHGVGAWYHLLTQRYGYGQGGQFTVNELACRYAGSTDVQSSAVQAYVRGWCRAPGSTLTPDATITLNVDAEVLSLASAMFAHEAGERSPLSDQQILFGVTGERNGTLPAA